MRRASSIALAAALLAAGTASAQPDDTTGTDEAAEPAPPRGPLAPYFTELAKMGLIDPESGNKVTLTNELADAERLLHDGAALEAAVALYAIVESPRYEPFHDFVEYQNAEYDLAVALTDSGAYGAALE